MNEKLTPPDETRRDWETIQQDTTLVTQRLRIVGGWLYRVTSTNMASSVALVFVPAVASLPATTEEAS